MDTEGWRRIMDVNTTGVFLGTKYAIPAMRRAGRGSIVNISSIMGFVGGEAGHPAYHASKGAVRIFTKATAVKYGPDGIRANSVHPGFMPPMRSSAPIGRREEQWADAAAPYWEAEGSGLRRPVSGLRRSVFYHRHRTGHRRWLSGPLVALPRRGGLAAALNNAGAEPTRVRSKWCRQRVWHAGGRPQAAWRAAARPSTVCPPRRTSWAL